MFSGGVVLWMIKHGTYIKTHSGTRNRKEHQASSNTCAWEFDLLNKNKFYTEILFGAIILLQILGA